MIKSNRAKGYGKLISHEGDSFVIFGYNGRDGVVTDKNGLIYMRARYYSPDMRRFINADIIAGELSNAITLNRFAYANGNPVSFTDPFGLWSIKEGWAKVKAWGKKNIVDPIVNIGKKVVNNVTQKATQIKDAVVETHNNTKEFIADTVENVSNAVVDGYNTVKNVVVETYNDVKDFAVDTYNDIKDVVVDGYNEAKDTLRNTIDTTIELVETVTEPISNKIEPINDWIEENGLNEFALHDSERQGNPDAFYEKILFGGISGSSLDLREANVGIGSAEINIYGGGYDWKYVDLALFDIGHAEASLEVKELEFSASLFASAWSPSVSINIGKFTIDIGAEVGAIGYDYNFSNKGISIKAACGWGASLGFSWG